MGFAINSDGTIDYTIRHTLTALADPRRYRHCSTCDTPGTMVQRAEGYVVICPNPACPAPVRPYGEVAPTRDAAEAFWQYLQGGAK